MSTVNGHAYATSNTSTDLAIRIRETNTLISIMPTTGQNTGTCYIPGSNEAELSVSQSEFGALCAKFPTSTTEVAVSLAWEGTLPGNVTSFSCGGLAIYFPQVQNLSAAAEGVASAALV